MPSWDGKTRGNRIGYNFFIFILKHIGISFAYFFLRFVVAYFVIFAPSSTKYTYKYYRKIWMFNPVKSIFRVFLNYHVFGQVIIDKAASLLGFGNKFAYAYDGEEHIHKMTENKTSGFLFGAHIGNREIAGHLLNRFDAKVNIVLVDAEQRNIKELLEQNTAHKPQNVNLISLKDDYSHIYKIKSAANKAELLCIHADRFLEKTDLEQVMFLGKKANFPLGPFHMAVTLKLPVVYVFSIKENIRKYHFYGIPSQLGVNEYELQPKIQVSSRLLHEYVTALENIVRQYPDQWFNYYDFWEFDS